MPNTNHERIDRDGLAEEAARLGELLDNPVITALLKLRGNDAAPRSEKIEETQQAIDRLHALPDRVVRSLTPLGWASFGWMPTQLYERAVTLAEAGRADEAEQALVLGWNEGQILEQMIKRVRAFPVLEADDWQQNLDYRYALLEKALGHHRRGSFEASVPIVLAQIDGLMYDLAGVGFFGKKPPLVDDRTLAGHPDSVAAVRKFLNVGKNRTEASGSVGRHGVLHGRELGYDTLLNSTKVFVALFALIEVAQSLAFETFDAESKAREKRNAGSDKTDDDGRRVDRREFGDTKMVLSTLAAAQFSSLDDCGEYDPNVIDTVAAYARELLGENHGVQTEVSEDRRRWMAWRRTVTGWVFAMGGGPEGPPATYYDGADPPSAPPDDSRPWPSPANW